VSERLHRDRLPRWVGPTTALMYLVLIIVTAVLDERAMLTCLAIFAAVSWLMDERLLNAMRARRRATPLCDALFPDLTPEQVTALARALRDAGADPADVWAVFGMRS
jgi:hypothetical protein